MLQPRPLRLDAARPDEVFRFVWENQRTLKLTDEKGVVKGYVEVQSVRPCIRIGPDGFVLRETVAEYIQILTVEAREIEAAAEDLAARRDAAEFPGQPCGSTAAAR